MILKFPCKIAKNLLVLSTGLQVKTILDLIFFSDFDELLIKTVL